MLVNTYMDHPVPIPAYMHHPDHWSPLNGSTEKGSTRLLAQFSLSPEWNEVYLA